MSPNLTMNIADWMAFRYLRDAKQDRQERKHVFGGCRASVGNFCATTQNNSTAGESIGGSDCRVKALGAGLLFFPPESDSPQGPAKAQESPKVATVTSAVLLDSNDYSTYSISGHWVITSPTVYMAYATMAAEFARGLPHPYGKPDIFCSNNGQVYTSDVVPIAKLDYPGRYSNTTWCIGESPIGLRPLSSPDCLSNCGSPALPASKQSSGMCTIFNPFLDFKAPRPFFTTPVCQGEKGQGHICTAGLLGGLEFITEIDRIETAFRKCRSGMETDEPDIKVMGFPAGALDAVGPDESLHTSAAELPVPNFQAFPASRDKPGDVLPTPTAAGKYAGPDIILENSVHFGGWSTPTPAPTGGPGRSSPSYEGDRPADHPVAPLPFEENQGTPVQGDKVGLLPSRTIPSNWQFTRRPPSPNPNIGSTSNSGPIMNPGDDLNSNSGGSGNSNINHGGGTRANADDGHMHPGAVSNPTGSKMNTGGSIMNPGVRSNMNPVGGPNMNLAGASNAMAGGPNIMPGGGSKIVSGAPVDLRIASLQQLPQAVITISGQVVTATADMENRRMYVGNQVLSVGEAPVTIAGQRMVLSSDALVIGSDVTLPLPSSSTGRTNTQTGFNAVSDTYNSVHYTLAPSTTGRSGDPTQTEKPSLGASLREPADMVNFLLVLISIQWLIFIL